MRNSGKLVVVVSEQIAKKKIWIVDKILIFASSEYYFTIMARMGNIYE